MPKLNSRICVANIIEEGRLGGPQNRLITVASSLNNNFDVTAILPKKNSNEFQNRCKEFNVKYYLFSLTSIHRSWINILKYLVLFPVEVLRLSIFFKKKKFDIVHLNGGSWQYKGLLAAKLSRTKVIWELNDSYAPFLIRVFFFVLSNLADGFIYGSNSTKKYYEHLITNSKKNFLIQSPVNVNYFNPSFRYSRDAFLKKINLKNKLLVGTVANVNPAKDLITFLKTIQKCNLRNNKIVFLIIGSVYKSQKKYFIKLNEIINQNKITNVYFLNSRKDVRPILKMIDIYVCSSKFESSPLSLWEAMSMEKAIVTTKVGDVKNFIKNGKNGYVVKVGDVEVLSKRILKLANFPRLRNFFGKSARKVAKQKLDARICATKHAIAYKKIFLY